MTHRPIVIVIHGPSGVGKDTVIEDLRRKTGLHRATSSTTRPPRANEQDGVHYHFLSEDDFLRKAEAGEFIEYAKVYGQWKGLESKEVLPYLEQGKDVIIRTDIQGSRTWHEKLEGAVFVLLVAEDREALRAQLIGRDGEDADALAERLAAAEEESADTGHNDYVVVNPRGDPGAAVREIEEIISRERVNPRRPYPRIKA